MAFQKNIRGLQDIRTHSGKINQVFQPHKAYMKISCLEMERSRLGKEREKAIFLMRNIDARFQEIEVEKSELLQAVNAPDNNCRADNSPVIKSSSVIRRGKGGFKYRY